MSDLGSLRVRMAWIAAGLIAALPLAGETRAQSAPPTYSSQWTETERKTFYTTSQGSHMMPYAWFKALRRLDADATFGADQLQRYGYIQNEDPGNAAGLP